MTLEHGIIRKSFPCEGLHRVAASAKYLYERFGAKTFNNWFLYCLLLNSHDFQAMPQCLLVKLMKIKMDSLIGDKRPNY